MLLNQIKIDPNVQPFKQAPRPMRIESLKKRLSSRQKAQLSWFHTGRRESRLGPAVFQWRRRKDKYACGDFRDLNKAYSKDEFSLPVTDSHWSHRHSFMSWHIHNLINIYISIIIKRTIHNVFWKKNKLSSFLSRVKKNISTLKLYLWYDDLPFIFSITHSIDLLIFPA